MRSLCVRVLRVAVLLPAFSMAGPIYSTVDANGNLVFSDAPSDAATEVTLKEATVVSGQTLGKKVKYPYGQPDSGKGSYAVLRQQRRDSLQKRRCADMKELMNSSAGRIKLNTESRYNRECILNQ